MRKVYFVAGGYGVGKTTICHFLSSKFNIKSYSASQLISSINKECYGKNKYVKNHVVNQLILIEEVNKLDDEELILDGHFCLSSPNGDLIVLDDEIFDKLNLSAILLIRAKISDVIKLLKKRDDVDYDGEFLERLFFEESQKAEKVSRQYNIPLYSYEMSFDDNDLLEITHIFEQILKEGNL